MPTPTKGKRLGGSPAHEKLMLANLATALFEHGSITTTETRARRLRPFAERLITKAKRGDLHARRQVMRVIRDKSVVHGLFTEIGPRFETRPGGYTRITKLGPRKGDNAPMAVIELVEEEMPADSASGSSRAPAAAAAVPVGDQAEEPTGAQGATADGAVEEQTVSGSEATEPTGEAEQSNEAEQGNEAEQSDGAEQSNETVEDRKD